MAEGYPSIRSCYRHKAMKNELLIQIGGRSYISFYDAQSTSSPEIQDNRREGRKKNGLNSENIGPTCLWREADVDNVWGKP